MTTNHQLFALFFAVALLLPSGLSAKQDNEVTAESEAVMESDAREADIDSQRASYREAMRAVKAGNYSKFRKLYSELDGYVLQNYAQYEYLKANLSRIPYQTLFTFIRQNTHAPVGENLRTQWLYQLARKDDWETFMLVYNNVDDDPKLTCYRLRHLIRTSEDQAPLMAEVEKLWLTGKRLPSVCNQVFDSWHKAGHMTQELVWERIKLAMERRQISLARQLAERLPTKERIWMRRWEAVHWHPDRELKNIDYDVSTPVARMIVKHGVVRLAYNDPEVAMDRWRDLKDRFQFFGEDENYVFGKLGILAAQKHLPDALHWLAAVSVAADDEKTRIWRVKAALRSQDWPTAGQFISALPEPEQSTSRWRYWRARVLEETGDKKAAMNILKTVATERGYYGFMAADRLDQDYAMQHESIEATPDELTDLLARPGILSAHELYALGDIVRARRQWNWVLRRMNNRELQVAAVVARHWGWHDRAIYTVTKSDHVDDLDLRFPVLYRDVVEDYAERTGIEASWIYGVIRQESAFITDARSSAGALGLMQLMPATGRQVGRRLKMPIRNNSTILNIRNNVLLGTNYLKTVLERNDGSQMLATASYNAGPHRVKKWLPDQETLPADVWVETIPYNETRDYVKNVMSFTAVYDHRLGEQPKSLRVRMPDVTPEESR
ncbi:MAG: transglycosylase SLT domain-containing protein [Gammaproteobacteria bacterium]|nr:transglycosylase SLT domain-containing protein [Gammaproteobacteria bacterium]